MTDTMTNEVVKEAKVVKTGSSEHGPWTLWNFKVHGSDKKFSYFEKDNIKPASGMAIQVLKYATDITTKGDKQYTNYTVKEITVAKDQPPTPPGQKTHVPQKSGIDSSITFYHGYAARFMSALIANGSGWQEATPETIADVVVDIGLRMYHRTHAEPIPEPEPEKTGDSVPEPPDFENPPLEAYEEMP